MPSKDWGKRMMFALQAVREMHTDASRLLLDLDRALAGYKAVYGSFATMDLSYDIKRGMFMSDGLFRHWVRTSEPDTVIAVNIAFWDDSAHVVEPLFIAAKLLYAQPLLPTPDRNKAWDPWFSYLKWPEGLVTDKLKEAKPPQKRIDILRTVSIGVPLASVETEAQGHELLKAVREYTFC